MRDRHGSRGKSRPGWRTWAAPPRSSTAHATAITHATADSAISEPRQPPSRAASGTTIAAATVEPIWMPVV